MEYEHAHKRRACPSRELWSAIGDALRHVPAVSYRDMPVVDNALCLSDALVMSVCVDRAVTIPAGTFDSFCVHTF